LRFVGGGTTVPTVNVSAHDAVTSADGRDSGVVGVTDRLP